MIRTPIIVLGTFLTLTLQVDAQSFNIDAGTGTPAPSSTFGAAAAQPGTWNVWDPAVTSLNLVDVNGATTPVNFTCVPGNSFDFASDNAGTSGDDEALLDDGDDPTPGTTYTITGLAAGTYTITTYAWAPDDSTFISGVRVNNGPQTNVGGVWPGTYQLGVTHAVDTVTITAGANITVNVFTVTSFTTFDGLQIHLNGPAFGTFCFGDGTGTACPCGNAGLAGNGCASSVNPSGARIAGSGSASIANDTLVLTGTGMPDSSALYFQGTQRVANGAGAMFGDGLRCAGGTIIRLGTRTNVGGTSSYPGAGNLPISVRGANSAGGVRDYQCWYRNAAPFCTASTFNLTNAIEVTWAP